MSKTDAEPSTETTTTTDPNPTTPAALEQIEREIQPYLPQLDVDDSGARQ